MKKQRKEQIIIGIIALLVLTPAISAMVVYPGEIINISSGLDEIIDWKIINNNTFINSTKINSTTISVKIPELAENLSFSFIFYGYRNEEEKVVFVSAGGGTKYVYKNITITKDIIQYVDKIIENKSKTNSLNETIIILSSEKEKLEKDLQKAKKFLLGLSIIFLLTTIAIVIIGIIKQKNGIDRTKAGY